MAFLLDTSVAISLRDGDSVITHRLLELHGDVLLPIVGRVELENGVYREPSLTPIRRKRLDELLETLDTVGFKDAELIAYRRIVETLGYSRRKMIDRMIAAQAIAQDATLVTRNAADFRDVPGLTILEW